MSDQSMVSISDADLPSNMTADMDADRLMVRRPPEHVLEEAQQAAAALTRVINGKAKPVRFNGETYLEFEDWQTVGRFYGVTARVVSTEFADFGAAQGFVARAEALRSDGQVISAAEAMCLNDEEKWSKRPKYEFQGGRRVQVGEVAVPLFQLRSMAQTRACAKALRNVLAWVVVLGGYRATPAEEMDGVRQQDEPTAPASAAPAATREASQGPVGAPTDVISEAQAKRLFAIARQAGRDNDAIRAHLREHYGIEHTRDVKRTDYDAICAALGAKA